MVVILSDIMVVLDISLKSVIFKLMIIIQPVIIQLVVRTLHSDNGDTLRSGNGGTGHLAKVTSCKLKNLIRPV